MTYIELLAAFGAKLGGGVELTPDGAGAVVLDVDEMRLTILGLEDVGQVVLTGVVGEPPPEEKIEKLYRAILEANHNFSGTFGATLSIDPMSGNVSLCKAIPLVLADGDSFFADVEHFINVLETWKKLVEDFRGAEVEGSSQAAGRRFPEEDSAQAAGRRFHEDGLGGFMQV